MNKNMVPSEMVIASALKSNFPEFFLDRTAEPDLKEFKLDHAECDKIPGIKRAARGKTLHCRVKEKEMKLLVFLSGMILVAAIGQAPAVGDVPGARAPLIADTAVLHTSGGRVNLTLNAGAAFAGRNYILLGSFSGTTPGLSLPGGGVLPLNWDPLTAFIRQHLNAPSCVRFLGTLDAGGGATAMLDTLGPLPPSIQPGWTMHLAFTTLAPFDFQSNAVGVAIKAPPVIVYVDDSNATGIEDGSKAHPFDTIGEGINAASPGEEVHVDDSGVLYNEAVVLKGGVLLAGNNWDPSDGTARPRIQAPGTPGVYTVNANSITSGGITGFDILPGGSDVGYTPFVHLVSCTDLSLSDCYFHGQEASVSMVGVLVTGCSAIEISHCHFEHLHGPDPQNPPGPYSYWCILADNSDDLHIHNVRMNDIGTNFDAGGRIVDAVNLSYCDRAVIHNNLVYKIVARSGGAGAGLVTGFTLGYCSDPIIYNNTVDTLDTRDNYFINQAFGYFLRNCPQSVFFNNMATNILSSGFPPPLARGIQAVTDALPCDFTLTWNVAAAYFGTAYANGYCVGSDPLYLDPQNGNHDIGAGSDGQRGAPTFVDWDDPGSPSGDPGNPDTSRRSRMGCHGGPEGQKVGLLTPH